MRLHVLVKRIVSGRFDFRGRSVSTSSLPLERVKVQWFAKSKRSKQAVADHVLSLESLDRQNRPVVRLAVVTVIVPWVMRSPRARKSNCAEARGSRREEHRECGDNDRVINLIRAVYLPVKQLFFSEPTLECARRSHMTGLPRRSSIPLK